SMNWITGKQVIVTGPTSGIGRQIALQLGALGADLVLACRDVVKGRAVATEIASAGGAGRVEVLPVDTSSQQSIRDAARVYRQQHPRLDVLVNNAGTVQDQRGESVDGIELTLATNVLGYHLLTRELLDLLEAGAPSRVVVVASAFAGDLDLDDLQFARRRFDRLQAYRQSKACNRLWSWALARRLRQRGVTVNAMTPGFVPGTDLSRNMPPDLRRAYKERTGRTIAQGADTAVWLASSSDLADATGGFYTDRREVPCELRNLQEEERLWRMCEDLAARSAT
ncbi:MAG TPA: SDR family NAD(P)-dependent oxidoreductase, partial [Vicinamibacterales bacterium]|nr:SDR family NAD(P)-dependent oxidoreductase [Vicinamibacterales bacterium]